MNFKLSGVNAYLTRILSVNFSTNAASVSAFFFIGCCSLLLTRDLTPFPILFWGMLSLVCLSIFYRLFLSLLVIFIGITWATFVASESLENRLLPEFEKKSSSLIVVIDDFPIGGRDFIAFTARVVSAKYVNQEILEPDTLVRLSCYRCDDDFELGDQLQVDAVLRRPRGAQSWGAFDYEKHALNKKIVAKGYIKKVRKKHLQNDEESFLFNFTKYRRSIQSSLQIVEDPLPLAILSALSIGDRSAFTPEVWRVLRATGLSHIVSISGLHIGLIFLIFRWLIRKVLNMFYPVYLFIPALYLETFFALICAAIYAGMAGFSVPTQRALIMLVIYFLSLFSPRKLSLLSILMLTIGVIMLLDPLAVLGSSFWLSVGAVGLIGFAQLTRKRSVVYFQWFLSLAMAPLIIGVFGEVSLISPIINMVVVPVVSFVLLPLLFASLLLVETLPLVGEWLLLLLSKGVLVAWNALLTTEAFVPISSVTLMISPFWVIFSAFVLLMIALWSVLPSKRILLLMFFTAIYCRPSKDMFNHGEFVATVFDVGQGLAVAIETPKGVTIFDTGNRYGENDSALQIIIPYLQRQRIDQLQTLIISHPDADHIGGLNSLIEMYALDEFIISDKTQLDKDFGRVIHQVACHSGTSWSESGVTFHMLAQEKVDARMVSRNNRSCVLLIESDFGSILLPGDIERIAEHRLVERLGEKLQADVLVLAHHGSASSTTPAFLQAVQPTLAIASSGYLSRHGHPHDKVVSRVEKRGIKLFNTATSGSVQFKFLETGLQTIEYRAKQRRFWYATD